MPNLSSAPATAGRVGGFASLMLVVAGCGFGAFGQARMAGDCPAGDANCKRRTLDAPVAVGAVVRPDLIFELRGSAAPSLHFDTADPTVLAAKEGAILGRAPGLSALFLTTDDGTVLDFFHVWVRQPTGLRLSTIRSTGSEDVRSKIELLAGESLRLVATPTADGQDLAGEAAQAWTVDPPIAVLLEEGRDDVRRLVATEPGNATLTVRSLGQRTDLAIVVRLPSGRALTTDRRETQQ